MSLRFNCIKNWIKVLLGLVSPHILPWRCWQERVGTFSHLLSGWRGTHCNQLWRSWPCPELTGFSRCHSCSLQADVPETWSQASGGLPAGGALAPSEQACAGACAAASQRMEQTATLCPGVPLINFFASTDHDIHSFNYSKNKCISLYQHSALAFYLF